MMQTTGDRVVGGGGKAQTGTPADAGAKGMRVYEVAKEIGLANKDLVAKIRTLGIEVKNHMSALEPDDVARIRRAERVWRVTEHALPLLMSIGMAPVPDDDVEAAMTVADQHLYANKRRRSRLA